MEQKTEFTFNIDENKTTEENLNDYKKAYAGFIQKQPNEELITLQKELGEYKTKERNSLIKTLAQGVSKENSEKLIKYTKFSDEDNEETISKKFKETHDELFSGIKTNTIVETPTKTEEKPQGKNYKFTKGGY